MQTWTHDYDDMLSDHLGTSTIDCPYRYRQQMHQGPLFCNHLYHHNLPLFPLPMSNIDFVFSLPHHFIHPLIF